MKAGQGNVGDVVRARGTVNGKIGRKGTITGIGGHASALYTVRFSGGLEYKFVSCDLELINESR